jgi:hypothetical protein
MPNFFPQILATQFSNHVYGLGIFTPLEIRISGWGRLMIKVYGKPSFKSYQKWISSDTKEITIDVPKGEFIKIEFRGLLGKSSKLIQSPVNNTSVSDLVTPSATTIPLPKMIYQNLKAISPIEFKNYLKLSLNPKRLLTNSLSTLIQYKQLNSLKTKITIPSIDIHDNYRFKEEDFSAKINHPEFKFNHKLRSKNEPR